MIVTVWLGSLIAEISHMKSGLGVATAGNFGAGLGGSLRFLTQQFPRQALAPGCKGQRISDLRDPKHFR